MEIEISDSDEDDCQLYTRTVEHFTKKRNEVLAKRRELETFVDLVPGEGEVIALKDDSITNGSRFVGNKASLECHTDLSFSSFRDTSDSEDNIPLSELSRNLKRKKRRKISPSIQIQQRPQRKSKKKKKEDNSRPTSQVRNLGVVVLDDDSGYEVDSLAPINFNSGYHKKSVISNDTSLETINLDFEDEKVIERDELVTLTIEWNNGVMNSRKVFKIRKYQKLQFVFEELAKLENINTNRVLLMYDFKSVSPMDTPSSLNLKFYGALIGSVSATDINHSKVIVDNEKDIEHNAGSTEGIQVKLLLQSKQTLLFKVSKHQKMDILYEKCADELNCEKSKLKLTFDGEYVEPSELAADLDIEDGDVFHVHVKAL